MTVFAKGPANEGFIVSEANGSRSREVVTVESGAGTLVAGVVLAMKAATEKYVPFDESATSGAENATAVLCRSVDATAADAEAVVIARDAEVAEAELVFDENATAGGKADAMAALAELGIVGR
jgi:hypothetical protein